MNLSFLDGYAVTPSGMDPIIRWVGGKRRLANVILPLIQGDGTYYEPFMGGASIALALAPTKAVLGDLNTEVVGFYQCVKDHAVELLARFREHEALNTQDYYYQMRDQVPADALGQAARFLYLNKAGFNGLYRQNADGKFNVPYGGGRITGTDRIRELVNLRVNDANFHRVSRWMNNHDITLKSGSYRNTVATAGDGDVVYLDPPYYPLRKESFTKYHQEEESPDDLLAGLKETVEGLRARGARVVMSNANAPAVVAAFPPEDGYMHQVMDHAWVVGAKGESRAPQAVELLIHT